MSIYRLFKNASQIPHWKMMALACLYVSWVSFSGWTAFYQLVKSWTLNRNLKNFSEKRFFWEKVTEDFYQFNPFVSWKTSEADCSELEYHSVLHVVVLGSYIFWSHGKQAADVMPLTWSWKNTMNNKQEISMSLTRLVFSKLTLLPGWTAFIVLVWYVIV